MKSSHFYYIILFSFLLAACKDDGPGEKENSDNDVPSVATNTWLLNSLDNIENYSNSDPETGYEHRAPLMRMLAADMEDAVQENLLNRDARRGWAGVRVMPNVAALVRSFND